MDLVGAKAAGVERTTSLQAKIRYGNRGGGIGAGAGGSEHDDEQSNDDEKRTIYSSEDSGEVNGADEPESPASAATKEKESKEGRRAKKKEERRRGKALGADPNVGGIAATVYQSEQQKRQRRLEQIQRQIADELQTSTREQKRNIAASLRRRVFWLKVFAFGILVCALLATLGAALLVNLERWSRIEGTPVAFNSATSWEEVNPYSGYCYCESVSSSVGDLLAGLTAGASSSSAAAAAAAAASSGGSFVSSPSRWSSSYASSPSVFNACSEASNSFEGLATLSIILVSLEIGILLVALWEAAYYGRFGGSHGFTGLGFALLLFTFITSVLSFIAAYIILLYEFCGMASFEQLGIKFGIAPWLRLGEAAIILLLALTAPLSYRSSRRGPQGFVLLAMTFVTSLSLISTCSRSWFVFDQQGYIDEAPAYLQSSEAGITKGLGVSFVGPFAYLSRGARIALSPKTSSGDSVLLSTGGRGVYGGGIPASNGSATSTASSSSSSSSSLASTIPAIISSLIRGIEGTMTFLASPPAVSVRYFGVRDSCQCTHPCAQTVATNRFGAVKSALGLFHKSGAHNNPSLAAGLDNGRDLNTNTIQFNVTGKAKRFALTSSSTSSSGGQVAQALVATAEGFTVRVSNNTSGGTGTGTTEVSSEDLLSLGSVSVLESIVGNKGQRKTATAAGIAFDASDSDAFSWYLAWATSARAQEYVLNRVTAYSRAGGSASSSSAGGVDAVLAADPVKAVHVLAATAMASLQAALFPLPSSAFDLPYSTLRSGGGAMSRKLLGYSDGGDVRSELLASLPETTLDITSSASSSSVSSPTSVSSGQSAALSSAATSGIAASLALMLMLPVYPQFPFLWALLLAEAASGAVLFLLVLLRIVDNRGVSVQVSQWLASTMFVIAALQLGLTLGFGPPATHFTCTDFPNTTLSTPSSIAFGLSGGSSSSSFVGSSSAAAASSFSISNASLLAMSSTIMSSVPQVGNVTSSNPSSSPIPSHPFSFIVKEDRYKSEKVFVPYYGVYLQVGVLAILALFMAANSVYLPKAQCGYHDVTYQRRRFHDLWWDILQDFRSLAQEDREVAQLMREDSSSSSDDENNNNG